MITSMECRERAVECRQMAERAPNVNVKAALIDMAQTWERLALQNAWLNHMVIADQMAFSFTELREKAPKAVPIGRVGLGAE
jgi:hypothetical protein